VLDPSRVTRFGFAAPARTPGAASGRRQDTKESLTRMSIERGLLDLVVDGAAVTGRFAARAIQATLRLSWRSTVRATPVATSTPMRHRCLRPVPSGFTTVALDRPGYGGSTPPASGADGFEAVAGVLAAAIGQVQAGLAAEAPGVVVTGHSSGAAIAVLLASLADLPFTLLGLSIVGLGRSLATSAENWRPRSAGWLLGSTADRGTSQLLSGQLGHTPSRRLRLSCPSARACPSASRER